MSSPPASYSTSATRSELVTTVSRGMPSSADATACVVVPADSATDAPGSSSCTAAAAIACFAAVCRCDLAANPGSSTLLPAAVAPPCTRVTRPAAREHLDVAPDRHVGDAEPLDQLRHPHAAGRPDLVEDHFLALAGKHRLDPFPHDRDRPRPTVTLPLCVAPVSRSVPTAGTSAGASLRLSTNRYRPRRDDLDARPRARPRAARPPPRRPARRAPRWRPRPAAWRRTTRRPSG